MFDIQENYSAHSIAEVLDLLAEHPQAIVTAGGTDVLILLRQGRLHNALLISIQDIVELKGIQIGEDGSIIIGACTSFDEIANDALIQKYIPLLAHAASQVGSPQIRHVATLGGNLCTGAVSADSAAPLLALDATLRVQSKEGIRTLPLTEFHTGPGKTVLDPSKEILTSVIISRKNYQDWGGCYLKFGQRNAMEIATLSCAAVVKLSTDKKHIAELHLAFGVAADRPVRCPKIERAVRDMAIDEALWLKISAETLLELSPRDSWRATKELREQLIRTQSVRAVRAAIEEAGGKTNGN